MRIPISYCVTNKTNIVLFTVNLPRTAQSLHIDTYSDPVVLLSRRALTMLLSLKLFLIFLPFLVEGFINIIREWLNGVKNGSWKTMTRLIRKLRRQNRRERIRDQQIRKILRYLEKINKMQTRTTSQDLHKTMTTVRNVLICLFDISQSTTDLGMTLTTDKQKTGKELVLYRPPASLLNLRIDVTAACDLARVFQTMLAAVHASQTTRPGHINDYPPTGLEVVVYRPRSFFHLLTLDLTVACDIARMFQSPSAALIYVEYIKLRVLNIHAELLDGSDGVQTQIVADETVSVDSEKQSCDDIFSLRESCNQQQTDVTTGQGKSHERDVEKEGSQAFLFDEDIAKLPYAEPMRPQQLVKWAGLKDVTDPGLDLDQQVEGWDVNDMFATNEADFGFKSTFDETLSEYTTLLVKEATPDYQLRWERACRLADEIEGKKKAEQANRAKQPKKRKKKRHRSKKSGCPY
ncbi:uncharacterized protein [Apostichopus japonicus]|uniref:uncharacterized protein isoform X2 n=1 Tax=Stichopus japonicus TaxID=307972 RepID=UPI003AB2B510